MYKLLLVLVLGVLLTAPVISMAASMPGIWPGGFWAPKGLVSCGGAGNGGTDNKPCQDVNDLIQTALNVIAFGMTLALFVAAPILIAWGGLMILISGGSPDKIGSGKKILTGTVIGIVIILCSYLAIYTLVSILGITGIGGFS